MKVCSSCGSTDVWEPGPMVNPNTGRRSTEIAYVGGWLRYVGETFCGECGLIGGFFIDADGDRVSAHNDLTPRSRFAKRVSALVSGECDDPEQLSAALIIDADRVVTAIRALCSTAKMPFSVLGKLEDAVLGAEELLGEIK